MSLLINVCQGCSFSVLFYSSLVYCFKALLVYKGNVDVLYYNKYY